MVNVLDWNKCACLTLDDIVILFPSQAGHLQTMLELYLLDTPKIHLIDLQLDFSRSHMSFKGLQSNQYSHVDGVAR